MKGDEKFSVRSALSFSSSYRDPGLGYWHGWKNYPFRCLYSLLAWRKARLRRNKQLMNSLIKSTEVASGEIRLYDVIVVIEMWPLSTSYIVPLTSAVSTSIGLLPLGPR